MENASKALIISAEVLIGVILISLMVFLYINMRSWGMAVQENIDIKEVYEFNSKFTVYDKRSDLTAQDVASIINLAKNYNKKYEGTHFKIDVTKTSNFPDGISNSNLLQRDANNKFLIDNSLKLKNYPDGSSEYITCLYECNITKYDNINLVSKIEIEWVNR